MQRTVVANGRNYQALAWSTSKAPSPAPPAASSARCGIERRRSLSTPLTPAPAATRRRSPAPRAHVGSSGGRVLKVFTTGASDDLTPRWWLEQRKLVPAAEFHPDLTWMHREGENRNFEPYEVAAALADGWTPHE